MHDQTPSGIDAVNGNSRAKAILLVEDDEVVRMLTSELLAELSYRVFEAEDAHAALTVLRSDQPLDLLMTDIRLPDMDGYQLMVIARQLRPTLRGLFASGYGDSAEFLELDAGTAPRVETICKPYSPDLLRSTLRKIFERA
jgi:CheY-like chemotaxis protein